MSHKCFVIDDYKCGKSRGKTDLFKLVDCQDDISNHLISYHLSQDNLIEYQLILARAGHFDLTSETVSGLWICPNHRDSLGKFWIPSKRVCNSPGHNGPLTTVKGRDVVSFHMAISIHKMYDVHIQLGSGKVCLYFQLYFDIFSFPLLNPSSSYTANLIFQTFSTLDFVII